MYNEINTIFKHFCLIDECWNENHLSQLSNCMKIIQFCQNLQILSKLSNVKIVILKKLWNRQIFQNCKIFNHRNKKVFVCFSSFLTCTRREESSTLNYVGQPALSNRSTSERSMGDRWRPVTPRRYEKRIPTEPSQSARSSRAERSHAWRMILKKMLPGGAFWPHDVIDCAIRGGAYGHDRKVGGVFGHVTQKWAGLWSRDPKVGGASGTGMIWG